MVDVEVALMTTSHVLPRRHLEEIGRIAVSWSYLERCVANAAAISLGLEGKPALLVTKRLSFQAMTEIIKQELPTELREEFGSTMKEVEEAQIKRNDAVHGQWFRVTYSTGKPRVKHSLVEPPPSRSGALREAEFITLNKLQGWMREIDDAFAKLRRFFIEHDLGYPVLPKPEPADIDA